MIESQQAAVEARIDWQSRDAAHTERFFFERLNFWRDILPGTLSMALPESGGEWVTGEFPPGELVPPYSESNLHRIHRKALHLQHGQGAPIELHPGRFYPRKLAAGSAGINSGEMQPMRILDMNNSSVLVDLNHPLARSPLGISARIHSRGERQEEHGGRCNDVVMDILRGGAGLQAAMEEGDTGFFAGSPFDRMDPRGDALFYQSPRIVQHIDAAASAHIQAIYRRHLEPGTQVLDLMSSWVSHLPEDVEGLVVTGLGMNREELAQNPQLTGRVTHDLNASPELPFADNQFDAAVCTVSVEYLVQPVEVFRELGRVLKPGAPAIITFSDRWFPTKAIGLWADLHPFERVGLVLEYFRRTEVFESLGTESMRGLPRPADDKYAGQRACSDPVFAVWGQCRG